MPIHRRTLPHLISLPTRALLLLLLLLLLTLLMMRHLATSLNVLLGIPEHILPRSIPGITGNDWPEGRFRAGPPICDKKNSPLRTAKKLAGVPGFEPGNARSKIWCLTAWRHPSAAYYISKYSRETNRCQIHRIARDSSFPRLRKPPCPLPRRP